MCGIVGQINQTEPIHNSTFELMVKSLAHRGPDGEGINFFSEAKVALGHRRLSIIDLSDAGKQPMSNEDQSVWLTMNGEIYNYIALRKELICKGHCFKSLSDSEVIIHSYEEWGIDCVNKFRGIFAFGLYDCKQRSLFLARDHVGVKPLYYYATPDKFVFASEPRAIIVDSSFKKSIDKNAFSLYLAYGNVPAEYCIYSGIRKLLPGHSLLFKDNKVTIQQYWKLTYRPLIRNFQEAKEVLRSKIEECVYAQSVSDVPVGTLLSGGVDSTIITSILSGKSSKPLPTFTIGFHEPESDERSHANLIANAFNTNHHEEILTYSSACNHIAGIIEAYDEPFHLNSLFPFFSLSQLVKNDNLKVVLGGDGGDELFAGYLWYEKFQKEVFERNRNSSALNFFKNLIKKNKHVYGPDYEIFFKYNGYLNSLGQNNIIGPAIDDQHPLNIYDLLGKHWRSEYPPVLSAQIMDFNCFMVDHCLTKVDRSSMANGVEVRVPFLDTELIDLVFSIDHEIIFRKGERKSLLKKALVSHLPNLMDKERKKGFSSPIGNWLKQGLSGIGKDFLMNGSLINDGLINPDKLNKSFDVLSASNQLMLISAELWSRRWMENDSDAITDFIRNIQIERTKLNE